MTPDITYILPENRKIKVFKILEYLPYNFEKRYVRYVQSALITSNTVHVLRVSLRLIICNLNQYHLNTDEVLYFYSH